MRKIRDPRGPKRGNSRIIRGGHWYDVVGYTKVYRRTEFTPKSSTSQIGFRLVLIDKNEKSEGPKKIKNNK